MLCGEWLSYVMEPSLRSSSTGALTRCLAVVSCTIVSIYFSFEQFDKVEAVWRRAFARSLLRGRPCSRAELYLDDEHDGNGGGGRTHAWVFGLAALFVSVNKALADVDDRECLSRSSGENC